MSVNATICCHSTTFSIVRYIGIEEAINSSRKGYDQETRGWYNLVESSRCIILGTYLTDILTSALLSPNPRIYHILNFKNAAQLQSNLFIYYLGRIFRLLRISSKKRLQENIIDITNLYASLGIYILLVYLDEIGSAN